METTEPMKSGAHDDQAAMSLEVIRGAKRPAITVTTDMRRKVEVLVSGEVL